MMPVPHPSFCALYRAAAPLRSLAARFRGADDALLSLRTELADPWLRTDASWEALANDPGPDTPLRRALARLANHPPPRVAARRRADGQAEFTEAAGGAWSPRPPPVVSRDGAQRAGRVADVLAASAAAMDGRPIDAPPAAARRTLPRPIAASAPPRRVVANNWRAHDFSIDALLAQGQAITAPARRRTATAATDIDQSNEDAAAVSVCWPTAGS